MKDLHHPCKETCSGWQQGFEAGVAEQNPIVSMFAASGERDRLIERVKRLRWELDVIYCKTTQDEIRKLIQVALAKDDKLAGVKS